MRRTLFSILLSLVLAFPFSVSAEGGALSQEALVNLAKPSVVHISTHVSGTAKIPAVKVDIRKRYVALIPDEFIEVPVEEYLSGSGFVIQEDGFIATNAHVVSLETVKLDLASESALSALFENALFLTDQEMQTFLDEEKDNFGKEVLRYVMEQSVFDLKSEIVVLRPNASGSSSAELQKSGYPAEVVASNEAFIDDQRDVAIIKIAETGLPALPFGNSDEVEVGKKVFIFGFPASAEINQNNPAESTFTQGVVSAFRETGDRQLRIFQTDAKVSQGSSGGPLLNEKGEVIGMIAFQTDELNRTFGDNFAFALPMQPLEGMAGEARVEPKESAYGKYFKRGFEEFLLRRCDRAKRFFTEAANGTHPDFVPERYTAGYLRQCEEWQREGTSRDGAIGMISDSVRQLNTPFFYLVGGSLILFGLFAAALLWLLRQLRRDEHEIRLLERRLLKDEQRLGMHPPAPSADSAEKDKKIV